MKILKIVIMEELSIKVGCLRVVVVVRMLYVDWW